MTEKEIEDLLEVAKEVNSFRLQASGTICPICGGHLRGDVKSTDSSNSILYGTLYCPSCFLFNVKGAPVSEVSDGVNGGKLSKIKVVRKAVSNIFALVNVNTRLRYTTSAPLSDIKKEDISFIK
ncbi:MAG: hypothetical protein HXN37_03385 [Prevotella histicola]|jgi:hypothetical protein|nr:hypothetical protein [Prevotella histicola]